jgi:hypothetical protein
LEIFEPGSWIAVQACAECSSGFTIFDQLRFYYDQSCSNWPHRGKWKFVVRTPYNGRMCRNIKQLFNFEPPATEDEIRAASLQFVRKISGFNSPSKSNQIAFDLAVDRVSGVARELLDSLVTNAPAKDREAESARLRARSEARFGSR